MTRRTDTNRPARTPARLIAGAVALAGLLLAAGPASADTRSFPNPAPISIPGSGTTGPASPYPSSVIVSGMAGPVTRVTVTVHRFGHARPIDADMLLVSPSGDKVLVKQRVCGSDAIEDKTWVFDQQAPAAMPESGPCDDFLYRPSNNGEFLVWGAELPPPYGVSFDDFNGEQANGTWSLYINDRESGNVGDVEGGWTLTVTTGPVDSIVPATGTFGVASLYPATRTVSGQTGVITDVNVNLEGVWHQVPDDLDALLVGPQGQKVVLMSDACGSSEVTGVLWEWNDEALAPMPDSGVCPTDGYRPSDYQRGEDSWPAPAPPGPYADTLSAFDLTDPNGEWRLFVYDDSFGGVGFFTERFGLGISTRPRATVAFGETAVEVVEGTTRTLTLKRSGPAALATGAVTVTSAPVSATSGSDFLSLIHI